MAIRIMHVVEALGVGGGVENGIANLIGRMDRDRFEHVLCAVFRLGPEIARYPTDRVRLVCLEQKVRKLAVQVGPLAQLIRKVKPDIVHSRNWGALEAVIAGRLAGSCSVIHSEHGVEMNPAAEPRRRRWVRRAVFGLADEVFAVSHQLRDTLARRTRFAAAKIAVIHNGVDTQKFKRDGATRHRFRAELQVPEDEFCIGCVGRLNKIKDYPTMLRAGAALMSRSGVRWRLFIVGDGSELQELQQIAAASRDLHGKVHFLGSTHRVPEFLNALDAYVLPSLCEGISNSLLEAMAAGVPVVASDAGGNPEVVVDGESGLLFPVGDFHRLAEQLVRLQGNQDLRESLRRRALQRVKEHFSLDAMVEQYEAMYERLGIKRVAGRAGVQEALCQP